MIRNIFLNQSESSSVCKLSNAGINIGKLDKNQLTKHESIKYESIDCGSINSWTACELFYCQYCANEVVKKDIDI